MLSEEQKEAIRNSYQAFRDRGGKVFNIASIIRKAGIKYAIREEQATQTLFSEALEVIHEYIGMSAEPNSGINSNDEGTSTLIEKHGENNPNNSVARTKAELDKITSELRKNGYNYVEIARVTGESPYSVRYRLQRISRETGEEFTSLSKMRNPKELFDELDKRIYELKREGKNKNEIAKVLCVSKTTVNSRLYDAEIARRIKKMIDYGITMEEIKAQADAARIDITNALKLFEIYMSEQMER